MWPQLPIQPTELIDLKKIDSHGTLLPSGELAPAQKALRPMTGSPVNIV